MNIACVAGINFKIAKPWDIMKRHFHTQNGKEKKSRVNGVIKHTEKIVTL